MNDLTAWVSAPPRWRERLAQLGRLGFLFFLIKGLVWVGIFVTAWAASGA